MLIDANKPGGRQTAFNRGFEIARQAKAEGTQLDPAKIVDQHMNNYRYRDGWSFRNVQAFREHWISGFEEGLK